MYRSNTSSLKAHVSIRLLTLLVATLASAGQEDTAQLSGTVVDPANAAVPNAIITLTSESTGLTRKATTRSDGSYELLQLPPGLYSLRVEATGFQARDISNLQLPVRTPVTLNTTLSVGAVQESVSVSASVTGVNQHDSTMGNDFNSLQITQLPIEARNVTTLLGFQPGVVFIAENSATQKNTINEYDPDQRNGSVNGSRSDQANITLDGVDVNDQEKQISFFSALRMTTESVQEFRVVTATPNADQGRSSGAQVSLVTRSGSNNFHGVLFESHRNTITSANDFFNNGAGVRRPKLLRNVFGGTLGGPILKNKLFFFGSYEGRRDASELAVLRTVPTPQYRQGIIRYRNTAGAVVTVSDEQFRQLDPLRIGKSQPILDVLRMYPVPNDPSAGDNVNTSGFRFNAPVALSWDTYAARFDSNLSDRHNLFLRGNLQRDRSSDDQRFPGQPPQLTRTANSRGLAVGDTYTFSSTLLNSFRYGLTRYGADELGTSGWPAYSLGNSIGSPISNTRSRGRVTPTHNLVDDVSWTKGRHSLSFGTNIRIIANNRYSTESTLPLLVTNSPYLTDAGAEILPPDIASNHSTPYRAAALALLGVFPQANAYYNYLTDGTVLAPGEPVRRAFRTNEYEFYVQDSWRLRPNLTLTYGLRYSLNQPVYEANGQQVGPDISMTDWWNIRKDNAAAGLPSSAAPAISYDLAGQANGRPGAYQWDKNNFSPRLAIAYSPGATSGWLSRLTGGPGRTSIRAGASVVYDRVGSASTITNDSVGGFGLSTLLLPGLGTLRIADIPRFQSLDSVPPGILIPPPPFGFPRRFPGAGEAGSFAIQRVPDAGMKTPYSAVFNVSVQRELPGGFTLEAAYVGRESRNLLAQFDVAAPANLADPASGTTYFQASQQLVRMAGTPITQVQPVSWWENMFPGLATTAGALTQRYGATFTRANPGLPADTRLSATQTAYYLYGQSGAAYTSTLVALDTTCAPACSKLGPYAFFDDQFSAGVAWRSVMPASYHAAQLILRKRFGYGLQLDTNYTFSKSIDWGSGTERSMQSGGSYIFNSFAPQQNRGVSDFDLTHQINSNWLWQLPFGRGRSVGTNMNRFADVFLGGWQFSGLFRVTSGFPISVQEGFGAPTNRYQPGFATLNGPVPGMHTSKNARPTGGIAGPNMFSDPDAAFAVFSRTLPGGSGNRNVLRGDGVFSLDTGVSKSFAMPWSEGHRLQFRWEAFNLTNSVRFDVLTALLNNASTNFGRYTRTLSTPRVMQFLLRYEF